MIIMVSLCNERNSILEPDPKKVQEGDICTVHPWPISRGGKKTRQQYLFIPIAFGTQFNRWQDARFLGGCLSDDGGLGGAPTTNEDVLRKRRFCITFSTVDQLAKAEGVITDWDRVRNVTDDYQPLLDSEIVFDYDDFIEDKMTGLPLTEQNIAVIQMERANGNL